MSNSSRSQDAVVNPSVSANVMQFDSNVKVCVRVRPQNPREVSNGNKIAISPFENQITIGDKIFYFDKVCDQFVDQNFFYSNCAKPLIESFLSGVNCTIFAYGQTGSGKTFTMGGPGQTEECAGLTTRIIKDIFNNLKEKDFCVYHKIKCGYLEIYQDEVRDLLASKNAPSNAPSNALQIREDEKGNIHVAGAILENIKNEEDLLFLLEKGQQNRTTGATQMNINSSRSHAIVTLILELKTNNEYTLSKFNLVDLAGSERNKRTLAAGERLLESISINCGLLALGNVISALGDLKRKNDHVPYRSHKLTRMLQDSLGGNSKTLMIACVSPCDIDLDETSNTLKYAYRARNIKNKPIINSLIAHMNFLSDENSILKENLIELLAHIKNLTNYVHLNKFLNEDKNLTNFVDLINLTVARLSVKNEELKEIEENPPSNQTTSRSAKLFNEIKNNPGPLIKSYLDDIKNLKDKNKNLLDEINEKNETILKLNGEMTVCKSQIFESKNESFSDLSDSSEAISELKSAKISMKKIDDQIGHLAEAIQKREEVIGFLSNDDDWQKCKNEYEEKINLLQSALKEAVENVKETEQRIKVNYNIERADFDKVKGQIVEDYNLQVKKLKEKLLALENEKSDFKAATTRRNAEIARADDLIKEVKKLRKFKEESQNNLRHEKEKAQNLINKKNKIVQVLRRALDEGNFKLSELENKHKKILKEFKMRDAEIVRLKRSSFNNTPRNGPSFDQIVFDWNLKKKTIDQEIKTENLKKAELLEKIKNLMEIRKSITLQNSPESSENSEAFFDIQKIDQKINKIFEEVVNLEETIFCLVKKYFDSLASSFLQQNTRKKGMLDFHPHKAKLNKIVKAAVNTTNFEQSTIIFLDQNISNFMNNKNVLEVVTLEKGKLEEAKIVEENCEKNDEN